MVYSAEVAIRLRRLDKNQNDKSNLKYEYQNPKSETNSNYQNPKFKTKTKSEMRNRFGHLDFEFRYCFVFRASNFVLCYERRSSEAIYLHFTFL